MPAKPAGLTYVARGTNAGHPMVAYRVDDDSAQAVPGFEGSQTIITVGPIADGFDNATVPQDGGFDHGGSAPALVGDYMVFDGSYSSEDTLMSAYGWNPFDLDYRPGLNLPKLSSLILDVLAAPATDPAGDQVPLPGHPGLVYERAWEEGADARIHIGPATPGVEYAYYDAGTFVSLLASDNHIELDMTPAITDPGEVYMYSSGYNVPNGSSSDKLSPNNPISGHVYLYDHGPIITDPADGNYGQDAWTNSSDSSYPDPAIPLPSDYSWPGVFGVLAMSAEWELISGSNTRANTVDDLGWFALLDEGPSVVIGSTAYTVSGFVSDNFDLVDIEAWVATQPGLTWVGEKNQQEFDYVAGDVWGSTTPDGNSTAWKATGPGHFDSLTNWPGASSGDNSAILDKHTDYRNRGYAWLLANTATGEYAWPFLERFNLDTGQWLPRIPLPGSPAYAAEGGFAVEHDGKLYFGGGDGQYADSSAFFMFDPATEEFTALPALPMVADYNPYGKVGDTLYVFLGSTMWAYDFIAGTWSSQVLTGPGGQPPGDWVQGFEHNGQLIFGYRDVFIVDVEAATITLTSVFQTWNGVPIVWINGGVLHMAGWDYASTDVLGANGSPRQFAFDLRDPVNTEATEEDRPGVAGGYASYVVKDGVPYVLAGGRSGGKQNIPPSVLLTGAYLFGSAASSGGGGGVGGLEAIGGTLSVIGGTLGAIGAATTAAPPAGPHATFLASNFFAHEYADNYPVHWAGGPLPTELDFGMVNDIPAEPGWNVVIEVDITTGGPYVDGNDWWSNSNTQFGVNKGDDSLPGPWQDAGGNFTFGDDLPAGDYTLGVRYHRAALPIPLFDPTRIVIPGLTWLEGA